MKFVPNGFYPGLVISLICLALMIFTLISDRKKRTELTDLSSQQNFVSKSPESSHVWKLADRKEADAAAPVIDGLFEKELYLEEIDVQTGNMEDPDKESGSGKEQEVSEHG